MASNKQYHISDLFEVKTGRYRPPTRFSGYWWDKMMLPPFSIMSVELMRRDPQIKLCMAIRSAPFTKPKFTLAGDSQQTEFALKTLNTFWTNAVSKVALAMWYTRIGGEVIYKRGDDGKPEFDRFKEIYPSDFNILTRSGEKYGIEVKASGDREKNKPVCLAGMKSFVYVHRRQFGSWDGVSEFEGAYQPWLEQVDNGGARAIRKLWFYKNAFQSGLLKHPPGNYTDPNDATVKIPWEDIARAALERMQTGASWTLPQVFDDKSGNPLWDYIPPSMNGSAGDILEYSKTLDVEITRGMEIPDDVIQQVGGTGSWAGRTIPLMAFFTSQNGIMNEMAVQVFQQIVIPLLQLRFGFVRCSLEKAEVDIEALMPSTPSEGGENQEKPSDPSEVIDEPTGENPDDETPSDDPTGNFGREPKVQEFSVPYDESKHKRGDQENAGHFASKPGGKGASQKPGGVKAQQKPGGKGPAPKPMSKPSGASSKPPASKTKPRVPPQPMSPKTKAEIAKAAHVMVDKTIQRYAEEGNEAILAVAIGGKPGKNSQPYDTVLEVNGQKHGFELKTALVAGNDKITMDTYAQVRKIVAEAETGCVTHTIVFDDRAVFNANGEGQHDTTQRKIYYRRGIAGSARYANSMHEVESVKELKLLISMQPEDLPPAAQPTDGKLRIGKWLPFRDEQGKGFKNNKTGQVVRAKK